MNQSAYYGHESQLFGVEKVFFAEPISDMVACVLSSCTYLLLSGRVLGDNRRL